MKKSTTTGTRRRISGVAGYIYAVENGRGDVKIGWTSSPRRRITSLQTDSSTEVKCLGIKPGFLADEKRVHEELNEWRLWGEWFRKEGRVLEFLATLNELEPAHRRVVMPKAEGPKRGPGRPQRFATRIWLPLTEAQLGEINVWRAAAMPDATLREAIWELLSIGLESSIFADHVHHWRVSNVTGAPASTDDLIRHELDAAHARNPLHKPSK